LNERRWRTIARVDLITEKIVGIVLPAWDNTAIIKLPLTSIPECIQTRIGQGDLRFYIKVNLGAQTNEELVITEWECEDVEWDVTS
jgi:hypothetical protein